MNRESVLDAVYATVIDPTSWDAAVGAIAAWFNADCAIMMVPRIAGYTGKGVVFHNFDPTPIANAYVKFAGKAEWTNRAIATRRAPGVFHLSELMPPAEQAANEYYREIMVPMDHKSAVFLLLTLPHEHEAPPVMLSLYRHSDKSDFDAADLARLNEIFLHLRRAIHLSFKPAETGASTELEHVLEAISIGAALIDANAQAVFVNSHAKAIFDGAGALWLEGRKLRAKDRQIQRRIDAALAAAVDRPNLFQWRPRTSIEIARISDRPVFLSVIPIGDDLPLLGVEKRPRAIVFTIGAVAHPGATALHLLRDYYGLTSAELEITMLLAAGLAPKDIAERRRTSIATVKTQVKTILSKTGFVRQSALVAFVASLQV